MANPFRERPLNFSIITPVYGDTYQTFEKFFGALNEQSYKDFEVVVVFDGVNKPGMDAFKKMHDIYPDMNISGHVVKHGGAPYARNQGSTLATGDVYLFLDPDVYLYPGTLQFYANGFEENPTKSVLWGYYDIQAGDNLMTIGMTVPKKPTGEPDYRAFKYSNFCSGGFPILKEAFIGWDETVKSLQDWDMWMRMLKEDNFQGHQFQFYPRSFFITDPPRSGGLSDDSAKHWIERVKYVREKNGFPVSDTVVTSGGAILHALNVAEQLGIDFLPDPTFKPSEYTKLYCIGFYTGHKEELAWHASLFTNIPHLKTKIIHWIGTDIWQLQNGVSWNTLKELKSFFTRQDIIHLSEATFTQTELNELGIVSKVVPLPPTKLFEPMKMPKQFAVAIYENGTQQMYHETLMAAVARSLPDVKFYFFGDETKKGMTTENSEHLGWINLEEWMPKFSLNLRITVHDGLPLTPIQFLSAGRNVIANVALDGAVFVEAHRKEIIESIRSCQGKAAPHRAVEYWKKTMDRETFKNRINSL